MPRVAVATKLTLAALFTAAVSTHTAIAKSYKYQTIDFNTADSTSLLKITNSNAILGYETTSGGDRINYLVVGTNTTTIADPNGVSTIALGLNNSNTVVGYYENASNTAVGFVYQNGTYTDFAPTNGTPGDLPLDISDSGIISGYYYDAAGASHGFLLDGTDFETFRPPAGMNYVFPIGVNNHKQVVLETVDSSGNYYGYLKHGKTLTPLAYPGAVFTLGFHINNHGLIAGEYYGSDGIYHGFVYDSATTAYYDIDYPGAYSTSTEGINDQQTLVGRYHLTSSGLPQGYEAVGKIP